MRAMSLSYTSREQVEVYRFSWLISVGLPLLMVGLQAFIPGEASISSESSISDCC